MYQNKHNRDKKAFRNDKKSGKKYQEKGKGSYDKGEKSCDSIHTNDLSWYDKYTDLYNDATRIPFNKVKGYPYGIHGSVFVADGDDLVEGSSPITIPNTMRINYVPGIGITKSYNDPANKAFQSLWSSIYSKTTGILQFPQYILGLMVTCGQSIAQNIALVKRALGMSYTYFAKNANYPNQLIRSMGIFPDSIIGHQDEVRVAINDVIRSFNALNIPDFIDAFKRHYSLSANVWLDRPDVHANVYYFMPEIYYIYSDLGAGTSTEHVDGKARAMAFYMPNRGNQMVTIDDLIDVIKIQIEALRGSHDFQSVLGSLQRAFESNNFITIDEAKVDEATQLVYDEVILNQIRNMTLTGDNFSEVNKSLPSFVVPLEGETAPGYSWDITGDPITNVIKYQPLFQAWGIENACTLGDLNPGSNVLRFEEPSSITPGNIMECTRLQCYIDGVVEMYDSTFNDSSNTLEEDAETTCHPLVECGIDFATTAKIYYANSVTDSVLDSITVQQVMTTLDAGSTLMLAALSQFWYAPLVYFVANNKVGKLPVGELDQWTFVDRMSLSGLNLAANLSVFRATESLPVRNF